MNELFSAWLAFLKTVFSRKPRFSPQHNLVPEQDHILRYIKPMGFQNGTVSGSEFLKKPNHQGTSVNWIEYFTGTLEQQIEEIRLRRRLEYKKTGALARLNVRRMKEFVAQETEKILPTKVLLSVVKDPLEASDDHQEDRSHALIKDVPSLHDAHAELVGDLIRQCVIDTHPAIVNK